jgi:hypothetical protein
MEACFVMLPLLRHPPGPNVRSMEVDFENTLAIDKEQNIPPSLQTQKENTKTT